MVTDLAKTDRVASKSWGVSSFTWRYPLSLKVFAVFALATVALLVALWLGLGLTFDKLLSDNVKPYLTKHLIALQNEVGVPPDLTVAKELAEKNPLIIEISAPGYRWSSNATFVDIEKLDVRLQRFDDGGVVSEAGFYQGNFILRTFTQGYIISFLITEKIGAASERKAMWGALIAIITIISALFAAITYLFHPVQAMERGIRQIGDGDIAHRLAVKRNDELGSLGNSINKMADNVESMLDAKRQLLLAISHELRTPITRSKLALSMLDDEITKESIAEDMNEMESLIEELLESERLRGNHAPLELHQVNINDVIYQVQGRFFEHSPLVLNLDDDLPELVIDPSRVGLAIKNVIKNAFTASLSTDDKVIVTTEIHSGSVDVCISDSGTGIEASEIPHLTEPFYRPDSSRQRKTGGFGIGLHLIKVIMEAHQGGLLIESDLGRGTTVTLSFPLSSTIE